MEICPQCGKVLMSPLSRLVQDSCGHKKCRMCLLQDESHCLLCIQNLSLENKEINSVIKYEHAGVITYNSTKQRELSNTKSTNSSDVLEEPSSKRTVKKKKSQERKRQYKFLSLPNHVDVLSENPLTYKCTVCNKKFHNRYHIKYHNYCIEDRKPFQCDKCSKQFISKYHLETHVLTHSNERRYKCDKCDKNFKQLGLLNRHKLIHADSKYICQQCGKSFKSREYLQKHISIHQNNKKFHCNICSAKFHDKSNLNKHEISHSKEKLHMCDECGKKFKFKSALVVHRRSHLRIRPYKCSDCFKTFVNGKELQRHRLIHLDIKAYTCSICSMSFRRRDNLQRHIRNTHPGKKGELIKKANIQKLHLVKPSTCDMPEENPNAIKVITGPTSMTLVSKSENTLSTPVPVINAPLKLAFKTSAFKNHYNIISREYVEPPRIHPKSYDYEESVSICQKILAPTTSPPRTIIKTLGNVTEEESTEICKKILSPVVPPLNNETNIDRCYSIRNIKFKLPAKYVHLSRKNIFNDINTSMSENETIQNIISEENKTYTELKSFMPPTNVASVIVNSQSAQSEMHWRRRTLQNLEIQSKQAG